MATTEELLISINESKTDIKEAIEAKGVTVGSAPLADYAEKIDELVSTYDVVNINNTITQIKPWVAPTRSTQPGSLPATNLHSCKFSPDGEFLAVGFGTSPYIHVYTRSGTTFTKLSDPASLPTGTINGISWSSDGRFLALGHLNSPYITIYERSGTTFTKLTNPGTLPGGNGYVPAFSPDSRFLAITRSGSGSRIHVYERSGTTFTKLTDPASLPQVGKGCSWSPDGKLLSVAHTNSPYVTIYERSGTTFTKLANPASLPPADGNDAKFSPDGRFLAVCNGTSATTTLTIYERSGTTFTSLSIVQTGVGTAYRCSWSPDSKYLAIAVSGSPYHVIYERSGTTFTRMTNVSTLPTNSTYDCTWVADGSLLTFVGLYFSTAMNTYETTGTAPSTSGKLPDTKYKAFTEV